MNSKIIKVVICLLCFLNLSVKAQINITLNDAISLANQNNLQLKHLLVIRDKSTSSLKQAEYNRLPSLSANPQLFENFGRSVDPSTNLYSTTKSLTAFSGTINFLAVIYQGGALKNQILENRLMVSADESNISKTRNDLKLNVITTFLHVLLNKDILEAAKEQTNIARQVLIKEQNGLKGGSKTKADISQALAQLSSSEFNETKALNQLSIEILLLKQLMEIPPKDSINVIGPQNLSLDLNKRYNVDSIISIAYSINPDIKLSLAKSAVASQHIKTVNSSFYPTLSFFGRTISSFSSANNEITGYNIRGVDTVGLVAGTNQFVTVPHTIPIYKKPSYINQLNTNLNQAIGLNLQIPIFNRHTAQINKKLAEFDFTDAIISEEQVRDNVTKLIYQAFYDVGAAQKNYNSAEKTFKANQDAAYVMRKRFEAGFVTSLDFNTSEKNVNNAQFDMIEAKYDLYFKEKIIDFYLTPVVE